MLGVNVLTQFTLDGMIAGIDKSREKKGREEEEQDRQKENFQFDTIFQILTKETL